MQLTHYTDYALRTLIYLAASEDGATVAQISEAYDISRNHLVKVAHHLGKLGYVHTTRGKSGGLRLAMEPKDINVGELVEKVEPNFTLVECFQESGGHCVISPVCTLKGVLARAERAFKAELSQYTLADIVGDGQAIGKLLNIEPAKS